MLVDGGTCQVLSSRQFSACCLQLWQNFSFKWPLSTTRIHQKCIETVHPGKCDFTVSRTLDMVIKRLNMCYLFFWQQWFFYWTFEAEENEVSTREVSTLFWFFIWKSIISSDTTKKEPQKYLLCVFLTVIGTSPVHFGLGLCHRETASSDKKGCFGVNLYNYQIRKVF